MKPRFLVLAIVLGLVGVPILGGTIPIVQLNANNEATGITGLTVGTLTLDVTFVPNTTYNNAFPATPFFFGDTAGGEAAAAAIAAALNSPTLVLDIAGLTPDANGTQLIAVPVGPFGSNTVGIFQAVSVASTPWAGRDLRQRDMFAEPIVAWTNFSVQAQNPDLVVFDNGALAPQVSRNMAAPFTMHEDFTLTQAYNITGFRWTQHDADALTREYLGTVLSIFRSVVSSDTLIFRNTIIADRRVTDVIVSSEPLIEYQVTGLSINLNPGTYFLGLSDPNSGFSGWVETTGTDQTIPGRWQGQDPNSLGAFFGNEDSVFQVIASSGLPEIVIEGGTPQECLQADGSQVDFMASLPGDITADFIEWFLDGSPVGSGEHLSTFVSLGEHSIEVEVTTTEGESRSGFSQIEIVDTTKPEIAVSLTDNTGHPVTSESQRITVHFDATDICDPAPVTMATGGVQVVNGGTIRIKTNKGEITVPGDTFTVTVIATDASDNTAVEEVILGVAP